LNIIFCEEKQKVGLFAEHHEGLRVPQSENHCRTVARESSIGGLYVCAGGLCVRAGWLDIQTWQKFH